MPITADAIKADILITLKIHGKNTQLFSPIKDNTQVGPLSKAVQYNLLCMRIILNYPVAISEAAEKG